MFSFFLWIYLGVESLGQMVIYIYFYQFAQLAKAATIILVL